MSTSSSPDKSSDGWLLLSLLGITAVIYFQVLGFGLIEIWDDSFYFIDRPLLRGYLDADWMDRLWTPDIGYPSPIPTLLYFLIYLLPSNLVVPAAHGISLAVHLLNVALVYFVVRRFFFCPRLAWSAAALWAVHPALVESVAWVTNLKSLGSGAALLGGILFAQIYAESGARRYLVGLVLLFLAGLACKPTGVVFLPLILAIIFLQRPDRLKDRLLIVLAAIMGICTAAFLKFANDMHRAQIDEKSDFAHGYEGFFDLVEHFGAAFFLQIRNILYPLHLHPSYFAFEVSTGRIWLGLALAAVLLAFTAWTYWRCRIATAGMLIFWATYLPASGIEYLPRFTADTYTYLPLFGLILSGAGLVHAHRDRLFPTYSRITAIAVFAVVATFTGLSFLQTTRWDNSFSLWMPVAEDHPAQYQPNYMMGYLYSRHGEHAESLRFYERAHAASPQRMLGTLVLPDAMEKLDRPEEALRLTLAILANHPTPPERAESYVVWLLVKYELPIPDDKAKGGLVRQALKAPLDAEAFTPDELRRFVRHLQSQEEDELAGVVESQIDDFVIRP